jgi:hypothetical protein
VGSTLPFTLTLRRNRRVGREFCDLVVGGEAPVLLIRGSEQMTHRPPVFHRERSPLDRVEQREDRGVDTDAQRE